MQLRQIRAVFHHSDEGKAGVTELEVWGDGERPYRPAPPPAGNIAYNPGDREFPRASASHSDRFGGIPERSINGRIIFEANPVNRWTSYGSPNDSDWLEVDFGEERQVGRVILHIYDDRGGVQAPRSHQVQYWTGSEWRDVSNQASDPPRPTGSMANTVTFDQVTASKVRVVFVHSLPAKSGVSEIEAWAE